MILVPKYRVLFWSSETGDKPVADWMRALPSRDKLYFGDLFRDLAMDGPRCRPKVFKHLYSCLWEIRDLRHPGPGYRVYFGFDGEVVCVVVAAGDKKSQQRDLEIAKIRLGL